VIPRYETHWAVTTVAPRSRYPCPRAASREVARPRACARCRNRAATPTSTATCATEYTGVSGDDYEFWNIVANTPVAESHPVGPGPLPGWSEWQSQQRYNPVTRKITMLSAGVSHDPGFQATYQRVVYFTADKPACWRQSARISQLARFSVRHSKDYGQRVLPRRGQHRVRHRRHRPRPPSTTPGRTC
jgi:hypothetical protein